MHHSSYTGRYRSAKHSMEHPVPILNHAAHRRRKKRKRIRLVWTPANITILSILAVVICVMFARAMSADQISGVVCDAFVHMAVC